MSSTQEYVEYVCSQIEGCGAIRSRKMFGEYMVYCNDKPVLLVCDNTVYVKKLDNITAQLSAAACGVPYTGAKEHYILDIEDSDFAKAIVSQVEAVTPIPKPRKKKNT